MANQPHGHDDPAMRRLQRAFAEEEPSTDLPEVLWRAATYLAALRDADAQATRVVASAAELAAARRREPAAVSRVYTAYAPALFRFFMAAVGDRHTAEELTGKVFTSAIEALPGFRGPVEALGGWLFRIARHDLYDHRRRQARARMEPLQEVLEEAAAAAGAADPAALALQRVEPGWLRAALQQLPADQREVLLLMMAAGLTAPEVAGVLNKTPGAVKALQHRGLASLARLLRRHDPAKGPQPPHPPPGWQPSTKQ
jgi:RNA polymerase sigma-70 factor, ECF subfamily